MSLAVRQLERHVIPRTNRVTERACVLSFRNNPCLPSHRRQRRLIAHVQHHPRKLRHDGHRNRSKDRESTESQNIRQVSILNGRRDK
jgi:hypothetical protein